MTDADVRTTLRNAGGIRGSLIMPSAPFEALARRAIGDLLPLVLQCKEFVVEELLRVAEQYVPQDVARFPALQVGAPGHGPRVVAGTR